MRLARDERALANPHAVNDGRPAPKKRILVVSLLMMGLSTFAIGLLPAYATIGS